jgi:hypothetical protein
LLAAVLVLHGVQSLRLFGSWQALIDKRPVVMVDHAIHLDHGMLGAQFLREHGTTWGYDPFFMAGYPETPVWDSSSNLAIVFQSLAGGRYSPRAYKLGLLTCTLLVAVLLPAGAFASGLGRGEAAVTAAIGTLVFWVSMPTVFWRSGLFAFVTASTMLGLVLGLLDRFDLRPTISRWAALLLSGAALLFVHVTAPVMIAGSSVGYVIAAIVRKRWKVIGAVIVAAGLALVLNAVWLVPLWEFRNIRDPRFFFLTADAIGYLWIYYTTNVLSGRIGLLLLVLAMGGLAAWCAEGRHVRAATYGGAIVVLAALVSAGGVWSVTKPLEPLRFLATLDLLLPIPAASAVWRGSSWVARRAGGGLRGCAAVAALAAPLLGVAWFFSPVTFAATATHLWQCRPLVIGLRPADFELLRWFRTETDLSARVLFEDQLRLLELTDAESTHWTPLLPTLLEPDRRSFIGGVYVTAFIKHSRLAAFGDYSLGDRRIDEWKNDELSAFCEQYNIGWVVCWSPLSRFVFDLFPQAKLVGRVPRPATPGHEVMRDQTQWRAIAAKAGPQLADRYLLEGVVRYNVYRIERAHSYFLEGKGELKDIAPNRVELADVAPDPATGAAVLSMHWLDTWKTDPPLSLAPAFVMGDPVPFVRINLERPLSRIVLYNGYGRK